MSGEQKQDNKKQEDPGAALVAMLAMLHKQAREKHIEVMVKEAQGDAVGHVIWSDELKRREEIVNVFGALHDMASELGLLDAPHVDTRRLQKLQALVSKASRCLPGDITIVLEHPDDSPGPGRTYLIEARRYGWTRGKTLPEAIDDLEVPAEPDELGTEESEGE